MKRLDEINWPNRFDKNERIHTRRFHNTNKNKALHESIMRGVKKNLKNILNEGVMNDFDEESDEYEINSIEDLWDAIIVECIATESELRLVTDINGYSKETLNAIIYARTGYRSIDQYLNAE